MLRAARKGPTIPDDGTAGRQRIPHKNQASGGTVRRLGRRCRLCGPGSDKYFYFVHVTLSGPTGRTHPKLVRGVSRDQPGPSSSRIRSLKSSGSTRGPIPKVRCWIAQVAQISAPTHPPREMGNLGVLLLYGAREQAGYITSGIALPTEVLPCSWLYHLTIFLRAEHHVPAIFLCGKGFASMGGVFSWENSPGPSLLEPPGGLAPGREPW